MYKISLTVALDAYEHAIDFLTGRVEAEGVDINWLRIPTTSVSQRFANRREFDVAEMPLAEYVARLSRGDRSIVALPVFLSRQFMPGAVWVRANETTPKLEQFGDERVRCAFDDDTVAVYMRHWLSAAGGRDAAGTWTAMDTASLHAELSVGEIAAGFSLSQPTAEKPARITRLVDDVPAAEQRYYQATGVFPILRVVCIHRDAAERHRWLAASLYEAFDRAKRNSLDRLIGAGMSRYPLPWLNAYVTQVRTQFGEDFWPYGVAANRRTLDAFLQTAKRQGVCDASLALGDLFDEAVSVT